MLATELLVLALAGLWMGMHFLLMAVWANIDLGPGWTLSPRDRPPTRPMRPVTGRLVRAMENYQAAFALQAAATLVVTLGDRNWALTEYLAWTWLAARLLYLPAYALGWVPWRSVIWGIGFGASMCTFLAALV